jgi:hypothetical protein
LITPIGGGVAIQARKALQEENIAVDSTGKIQAQQDGVTLDHLEAGQWWWD